MSQLPLSRLFWASVIASAVISELIVVPLSLAFTGRITSGYLATTAVTAVAVSIIILLVLGGLLKRRRLAEQALRERLAERDAIIDSLPCQVMVKDASSRTYVRANREAEAALGRTRDELSGLGDEDLFSPEQAEILQTRHLQLLAEGGKEDIEQEPFQTADGTRFMQTREVCIRDARNRPKCLVRISRDITDRVLATRSLEKSQRFLDSIFDAIRDGISVLDRDLNVLGANRWMEEIFAARVPSAGRRCSEKTADGGAQCNRCPARETLDDGEVHSIVIPYPDTDRPEGWIELSTYPVKDRQGSVTAVIEYAKDITERMVAEASLKRKLQLEQILSSVSSRFVGSIPIDEAIRRTLGDIGRLSGASRAHLTLFDDAGASIRRFHEWCAQGVACRDGEPKGYSTDMFPWLMEGLERGEPIAIDDVHALPAEAVIEKDTLAAAGVRSILIFPLKPFDRLAGFICLDAVGATRKWTEEDRIVLRIVAEIISNALERVRSEAALRRSEERHRSVVENVKEVIFQTNPLGQWSFLNPAWTELTGWQVGDCLGRPFLGYLHPEDRRLYLRLFESLIAGEQEDLRCEVRCLCKGSGIGWVEIHARLMLDRDGEVAGTSGTLNDVTERKRAEEALAALNTRLEVLIEALPDAVFFKDGAGRWLVTNAAAKRLFQLDGVDWEGKSEQELAAMRPELRETHERCRSDDEQAWKQGRLSLFEEHVVDESGVEHIYDVRKIPLFDGNGEREGLVIIGRDVTDQTRQKRQLEHIALHDSLTDLPNRILLADRLHQAMVQAERRRRPLAVAYLDLDGFKAVNDHHGHETGDQLLVSLANRMRQSFREGDTFARLGGDEFVAVLIDYPVGESGERLLARLLEIVARPVHLHSLVLTVSASLGVSIYPQDEELDADQLLRQADQAMYQAKLAGKNRFQVFDSEQARSLKGQHEGLERVRRALHGDELLLHYQPIVNMRTGAVIGVEALIRWNHPERGLLLPGHFLPVVEGHDLALELGEWVIETALTQQDVWRGQGVDLPVSVNVAAYFVQHSTFLARLQALLIAHPGLGAGGLSLELQESGALEDMFQVSEVMYACRDLGVEFALDDFGTGYSTLSYLKHLPATQLKIDKGFVGGMLEDVDDLAILEGVVGLATAFRRQAVAEGVETVPHGALLLRLGCDLGQGYAIARPLPAGDVAAWIADWRPDTTWEGKHRVGRDDLPLLFARVEHRAWIKSIEQHLRGERSSVPTLDPDECHVGRWLLSQGGERYRTREGLQRVLDLHRSAHALGAELCGLYEQGRADESLTGLADLDALGNALDEQFDTLLEEEQSDPGHGYG